jgi:hypothetical protein
MKMKINYDNWKGLKRQPLILNIAGPPRCDRKRVAEGLAAALKKNFPALTVVGLHPGRLFRVLTKLALDQGVLRYEGDVPVIQDHPALERIAGQIATAFDGEAISINGFDRRALEALDWEPCVDNAVSLIAESEPARSTLLRTSRMLDQQVEDRAEIVVTSGMGQHPRAHINFFLAARPPQRARLFVEGARAHGADIDDDSALASTLRRDLQAQRGTRASARETIEDEEDATDILRRYPGQFIVLDANQAAASELVERMLPAVLAMRDKALYGQVQRDELLTAFLDDRRLTGAGSLSLLMLKGGPLGGLNGTINAEILKQFASGGDFDYIAGAVAENRLEAVVRRKGRIREWSRSLRALGEKSGGLSDDRKHWLHDLADSADGYDHLGFIRSLEHLAGLVDYSSPGDGLAREVLRIKFFLRYITHECQYLLLRRRAERSDVLRAWGINARTARAELEKAFFQRKIETSALNEIDEQDFVKLLLVGDGNSDKAHQGSLRQRVYKEFTRGPWREVVEEEVKKGLKPEHLLAIANAVHGPGGPFGASGDELPTEIALLSLEDTRLFKAFTRLAGPHGTD